MVIKDDELKMVPANDKDDEWTPPPRIVVDLSIPDGVELVLMINGVQLMPEEREG